MKKSELIKIIAQNSGVPDSDAKMFFEVFLKKLVSHSGIKQSIKVPGIGYFELKKDYIKSKGRELEVISFTDYKESGEQLFFNIPDELEPYSSLDTYFTPSFGKPIIPFEGVSNTGFIIRHSGIEYQKVLESKAEKLLKETEITEAFEDSFGNHPSESHSIPEEEFHKPEKKDISWKSVPVQEETQGEPEELDSESISWDFGESFEDSNDIDSDKPAQPLLQELEDKKTEITSDKAEELKVEAHIPDNYSESEVNVPDDEQKHLDEMDQLQYDTEAGEIPLEQGREDIEKTDESELSDYRMPDPEIIKTSPFSKNVYEKVEPLIVPLLVQDKKLEDEDIPPDKDEEYIFDEEGYARVTPKIASLLQVKEEEEKIVESPPDRMDVLQEYDEINETPDDAEKISKPRRSLLFVGALVLLIVIIGGVYLYTYYFGENSSDSVAPTKLKDRSSTVFIERSYEYPVTYPYNKNTIVGLFDGINPDLIETSKSEEPPQINGGVPEIDSYEPRPSKLVKGYIFQYENFYAVQVSSWKSLSIAQAEMLKYRNSGLNGFIEEAQVKGSKYYRVRVGFKTLAEVEAYLAK